MKPLLTFAPILLALVTGCAGQMYQASAGAPFEMQSEKQIDDEEIAKAFQAKPQLPRPLRIAYYSFDGNEGADLEAMLKNVDGVESVYRIPPLLLTGSRRFQDPRDANRETVGVRKLRLFAARAKADLLVVFDHGYRGGGANGWAILNPLLVTMLFTPWLSNETESYAQAYLLDVRNGFLYGDVSVEATGGKGAVTVWGPSVEQVAKRQSFELFAKLSPRISEVLGKHRS